MARITIGARIAHLGRIGALGLRDFGDEWQFGLTRALFLTAAMWLLWALALSVSAVSHRPLSDTLARIARAHPTTLQFRDARAWDGTDSRTAADTWNRITDPCAPTRLAQWRAAGGWHPNCLTALPNGIYRTRHADSSRSFAAQAATVEVTVMAVRRQRPENASLVAISVIPNLRRQVVRLHEQLAMYRRFGVVVCGLTAGLLLLHATLTLSRRDPRVALREVLGQRPRDTLWASTVELASWSLIGSAIPLLVGRVIGLPVATHLIVAGCGFLTSIAGLGVALRLLRRASLAARMAAGAD